MKVNKRKKAFKFRLKLKKITLKDAECEDTADSLSPKGESSPIPKGKFNQTEMFNILPQLFMSGYPSAKDQYLIKKNAISHIINLTSQHCDNVYLGKIQYTNFKLSDNSSFNLLGEIDKIINKIDKKIQKGENVLVHCKMGVSRAPSIIIAYLIIKRGMSYNASFEWVLKINPKIAPNLGYLMQLQNLDSKTSLFN